MTAWKTWPPPPSDILRGRAIAQPSLTKERFWAAKLNSRLTVERTPRCLRWYFLAEPFTPVERIIGPTFVFEQKRWPPMSRPTGPFAALEHRKVCLRWSDT